MSVRVVRRTFLKALGLTGLALAWVDDARANTVVVQPNVFVTVREDGVVSIVCHRSEMGQGVRSSLPVLIADELGADVSKIEIFQADGDAKYGDQNTDGSRSVRGGYDKLRQVGATARVMLITVAAKRWKVKEDACTTRDGFVVHDKQRLAFGELVRDAMKLPVPKEAKPRADLAHVGTELPLVDGPPIVTGTAKFAADVMLPGMRTAVIARPPVVGGRVAKLDDSKARAIKGVIDVVQLPVPVAPFAFQPLGGVAVIATDTWAAMRGRAALSITWDDGPNGTYDSAKYRETLSAAARAPGKVVRKTGDVDAALAAAKTKVEAEYYVPHLAHASMEPPAAVAKFDGNKCEIWTSTQDPQTAKKEVAKQLGLDPNDVTVHVTYLGGGFGRKSKADFVVEAAWLAKKIGAPVRVQWSREDDLRHDYFHTVSAEHLPAGLDASGKVTAWLHRNAFPSIRSTFNKDQDHADVGELGQGVLDLPLAVPNVRAENGEAKAHVRIGWLRSVHNIHHAFAVQSFMDEIAQARGVDPRDNLLDLFGPPRLVSAADLGVEKVPNYGATLEDHPIDTARMRHVIERVTALSDWKNARKSKAMGVAAHRSFLTYVAVVVAVSLDDRKRLRLDEAWIVADAGTVINLERARSQMEGAVVFGASIALHSEITMKKGAVVAGNFRDYRLMRIADTPKTHVEIVASKGKPCGIGEPGVPPVAPAIANAAFALTGKRYRSLPITLT
ncbi:MAG: molybdopterin cofactor-binding domain-containing protein [Polyangiales bacterium]